MHVGGMGRPEPRPRGLVREESDRGKIHPMAPGQAHDRVRSGGVGAQQERRNAAGAALTNQRLTRTIPNAPIRVIQKRTYVALVTRDQGRHRVLPCLSRLVLKRFDRAVKASRHLQENKQEHRHH